LLLTVNFDFESKSIEISEFGHLQVLVNCAGIGIAKRIYNARKDQLHSLDEFARVININLNGSFNMMSQATKVMVQNPADAQVHINYKIETYWLLARFD